MLLRPDKKLVTVAIHTYEKAIQLKSLLEKCGIEVVIHNVNLEHPVISVGVRVRIKESDLAQALRIIEQATTLNEESASSIVKDKSASILIPIDFSAYSEKACLIGFDYANRTKSHIVLLHSFVSDNYSGSLPFGSDRFKEETKPVASDAEKLNAIHRKMHDFAERIKSDIAKGVLPEATFECVVSEGVPEEVIIEYAGRIKAELVIMGTRGKSKKETELIGSITAEVLDAGKYPIFTVPENISISSVSKIKRILFFNNLSQDDLISLDTFTRLFDSSSLEMTLINVSEKKVKFQEKRNEAVLKYCQRLYPMHNFRIKELKDVNQIDEINRFVTDEHIDMVIIPTRRKNIFARLFNPSMAHKLLFYSDIPMLVVPI